MKMNTMDTYTPLDGLERVKVMIFFVLVIVVGAAFAGSGIVVALLLFISLYIMKKDKNMDFMKKSQVYVVSLFFMTGVLLPTVGFIVMGYVTETLVIVSIVSYTLLGMLSVPFFYRIFYKHEKWIIKNGIYAEVENKISEIDNVTATTNKTNQNNTISTADAVLKYNELLEKGLITQEQFEKKRDELFS